MSCSDLYLQLEPFGLVNDAAALGEAPRQIHASRVQHSHFVPPWGDTYGVGCSGSPRSREELAAYPAESGDPEAATPRIDEIIKAVDVLIHSPFVGSKVKGAKRELVIGRAARGYVVLYRFLPDVDTVFLLALRNASS